MLFNSLSFLVFFPVTTIIYFALPRRFRWVHLLACSCLFYASFIPRYLLILFGVILIDYGAGLGIERSRGGVRRAFLVASIVANVGILAAFKYFNFLNANVRALAEVLHWNYPIRDLGWLLPIGLSFHTFQSMSYTIEVYLGRQKAERHLGIYALYVMFYPQLVAGPIERPQNLLHQFREYHPFDADRTFSGLRLMLWGFFKKLVVADRLAPVVDVVYGNPHAYGGAWLLLATYFFAVQIYCDFSGYSDVAIGAARVLGFKLMTNFNRPYAAASVTEFWRRWHISLSTWFRDYLYIPLGGSRVSKPRWCFNILIVFLISGMWHGSNWTYLAWGGLHGILVILTRSSERLLRWIVGPTGLARGRLLWHGFSTRGRQASNARLVFDGGRPRLDTGLVGLVYPGNPVAPPTGYKPVPRNTTASGDFLRLTTMSRAFSVFVTFNLVSLAWIFFRSRSIGEAGWIISHLVGRSWLAHPPFTAFPLGIVPYRPSQLRLALLLIIAMMLIEWAASLRGMTQRWQRQPVWVRWPAYYALILFLLLVGDLGTRTFIYFQF
jgi:D-alanyl-lipoteichoic acid acyltransferase DltB (MBOAT superfamily)